MDLYQLTVSFRGLLEDALEMMDEDSVCPAIGECFEDMAEVLFKVISLLSNTSEEFCARFL